MKIVCNKSKFVFNITPSVAWELSGDYAKFKNSEATNSYLGIMQYTRLMSSDVVFDAVKFNRVKGEVAMTVNYQISITDYVRDGYNEAPQTYAYPGPNNKFNIISQGTINIGTETKDIIIEVPETTVLTGKEVVCMLYGDGEHNLVEPTLNPTDSSCNACVFNNTSTMIGDSVWLSSGPSYGSGTAPALTLLKK